MAPSHLSTCATARSTTAASSLVRTSTAMLCSHHTPPSTSHLPRHRCHMSPYPTAVGLPHPPAVRTTSAPLLSPCNPIGQPLAKVNSAAASARLADRILLRTSVPGSPSACLLTGGLRATHDILLLLSLARTTSLPSNFVDPRSLPLRHQRSGRGTDSASARAVGHRGHVPLWCYEAFCADFIEQ
jgi:hypothetical protein